MPYITEELYHLLPKTHLYNYKSICIAPYPDSETERWRDFTIEEQFEFILKIMKAIRSTRADYNLANKQKTEGNSYSFQKSFKTKFLQFLLSRLLYITEEKYGNQVEKIRKSCILCIKTVLGMKKITPTPYPLCTSPPQSANFF